MGNFSDAGKASLSAMPGGSENSGSTFGGKPVSEGTLQGGVNDAKNPGGKPYKDLGEITEGPKEDLSALNAMMAQGAKMVTDRHFYGHMTVPKARIGRDVEIIGEGNIFKKTTEDKAFARASNFKGQVGKKAK